MGRIYEADLLTGNICCDEVDSAGDTCLGSRYALTSLLLLYIFAHSSLIGLIFVVAQAGAAIFPAITGVIAVKAGVGTLQPVLIGLLVAMGLSWALVPKVQKRTD